MFDRLALWVMRRVVRAGTLTVTTPSGMVEVIGSGGPVADIVLRRRGAWFRLAAGGNLGFAEAYMDGWIDTSDLRALTSWGVSNQGAWGRADGRRVRPVHRIWQSFRHRRHHEVETMADHYDLGNDFYASWLDASMTYSSALFDPPGRSLEEAQAAKYDSIIELADLRPGMRVLEIGTGWGAFAHYAAALGCSVVTVTISKEQAEYAEKRIADAGLADLVEVRFEDFRQVAGSFDRVVSIEMIESIDETLWPALFAKMSEVLTTGGRAVLQAITIDDRLFHSYRERRDFIQRYIFPGGQLPSIRVLDDLARRSGFDVDARKSFGGDYATTLAIWNDRFQAAWPALSESFDERFRRMWSLYLAYCEAGFRSERIDVWQIGLRRV